MHLIHTHKLKSVLFSISILCIECIARMKSFDFTLHDWSLKCNMFVYGER